MQSLAIAAIRLEGFPMPDGNVRVVLHSTTGQQELFVALHEWCRLGNVETVLDAAARLITEAQAQRDRAIAEADRLDELHRAEIRRLDVERARLTARIRELEANHAEFVGASHG